MGYACPVCGAEQTDGVHLANHLAITASLGRTDHLAWLDEHAPDWADAGPEDLAAVVREHAPEVETPEFASGHSHSHSHSHDHGYGHGHAPSVEDALARQARGPGREGEATTAETERALSEARELTRRMYEDADVGVEDEDEGDGDGDGARDGDADGRDSDEDVSVEDDEADSANAGDASRSERAADDERSANENA